MARFRIIITTCIIAFAIPLMATEDIPDDEAHFGARLQLEFNTSSRESQLVQWGPGGSAGIAYYAPFGRFTYFNAGLMALYDTFRYDGPAGTKYNPQYFDGHIDMIGLRLPLDFGFKFYENRNLRLSIYTGTSFLL